MLFKSYDEAKHIVLLLLHNMNEDSRKDMKRNFKVIDKFDDIYDTDRERIRGLTTSFFRLDELYSHEEAIDIGFENYLIKKANNMKSALEYHKHNCSLIHERKPCYVCKITKKLVEEIL